MNHRLTVAQAIVAFLQNQFTSRDGREVRFFEACIGIFGHGNVAGMGQALEQDPGLRYVLVRNEQAMVHTAAAFAKMSNRMRAMACTSSIGPGATNMVTGAALATINRLPVLLLPGDIFAKRNGRAGAAATGIGGLAGYFGQRLLQAGFALLGSHQPAGADPDFAAGSDARAHFSCGDRSGDALPAAGRAGGSVRFS